MRKYIIFLVFFQFTLTALFSEVDFHDLDLSLSHKLIFGARTESPGFGTYDTLFVSDLQKKGIRQLTFFPERVMLLEDNSVLQIQNRFGVFRSDADFKGFSVIKTFPSFVQGGTIVNGKINPLQISPDGKFLVYLKQKFSAFGTLVLFDLEKGEEVIVSKDVELSLKRVPALWSPDSAFLIYSKGGNLYYYSINQLREQRIMVENFRGIGAGRISNVKWGKGSDLYYISGDLVYTMDSRELFTRSLYSGFLKIGKISGKLPFKFDPNSDSFWIAPDGSKILLNKGGRNLFLYILSPEDFLSTGGTISLPYLFLPRNTRIKKVLWTSADIITLLAVSFEKGKSRGTLFRLSLSTDDLPLFFKQTSDQGVVDCIISPDEERIALIHNENVVLKNYITWKQAGEIDHFQAFHVLWTAEDEIIIAGALFSALYNLSSGETRVLAISQAESFGFAKDVPANANTDVVQLIIPGGGKAYGAALDQNYWQEIENYSVRERNVASDSYRVYLKNLPRGNYRNMVMVRDIRRFGTIPLFSGENLVYEQFPSQEEAADFTNFSHGSRIRQREVALVFNAIDNIEGLTPILDSLAEYDFRCTFFINGEVIRRYPDAVREIAESGHEVGSLFYAYFNMTDSRFLVDKDFIKSGLGRNEDAYFAATGKELSLFWHAPYYFVNSAIIEASREMNYTYIGRDVDSLDWVTREAAYTMPDIYLPAAQLIERIMKEKKPGSIIPVQVGMSEGGRDDYLFNNIDILIDNLVKVGYRIVTVSTLVENAR